MSQVYDLKVEEILTWRPQYDSVTVWQLFDLKICLKVQQDGVWTKILTWQPQYDSVTARGWAERGDWRNCLAWYASLGCLRMMMMTMVMMMMIWRILNRLLAFFRDEKSFFCVSGKTRLSASLEAKTNGAQCFFQTWEIQSHQGFRVMPRLRWDFLGGNSSDFIFWT